MNRRQAIKATATTALGLSLGAPALADGVDKTSQASLDTVMSFMGAMGGGDMDTVAALMHNDMVWQNEGDKAMPWIGPWNGKEEIFAFLGVFSKNLETTFWETEEAFASGDTVAIFGRMNTKLTKSGVETTPFTFALRAKVQDGQVILWNWFEDSYAVSQAFHAK